MNRLDYAIVFVSDMMRSVGFYRDVLGLPLKFESPHWTEFANEGSTIALHLADSVSSETESQGRTHVGTCHLGFHVENLDEIHRTLESKGVRCLQPPKKQDFGIRLALYADPDGLPLSIAQPLEER